MILRPQHILRSTDAFNATTSDINFGVQASSQNPTAQTCLAYIFPVGSGEGSLGYIWSKVNSGDAQGMRFYVHHNSGSPYLAFAANSSGITYRPFQLGPANSITYNRWQHAAAVWSGEHAPTTARMRLYVGIDGAPLLQLTGVTHEDGNTAVLIGASDNLHIGNRQGTDATFNGTIAYVARWDRMLTMPELWTAQAYGPLTVPRGLILCWANGRDYGPYGIMPTSSTALQGGMMPSTRALGYTSRGRWFDTVAGSGSAALTGSAATSGQTAPTVEIAVPL